MAVRESGKLNTMGNSLVNLLEVAISKRVELSRKPHRSRGGSIIMKRNTEMSKERDLIVIIATERKEVLIDTTIIELTQSSRVTSSERRLSIERWSLETMATITDQFSTGTSITTRTIMLSSSSAKTVEWPERDPLLST